MGAVYFFETKNLERSIPPVPTFLPQQRTFSSEAEGGKQKAIGEPATFLLYFPV